MSTTFIATLRVKPERAAEFERLQCELSTLTHAEEPDCLVYDVIRHRTEPCTYVVYSRFRDEAAFEAHQKAASHERLVPPILDCLAEPMELKFYDWLS